MFILFLISETTVPRKNIVNYVPTIEDKKKFYSKILPFHTMYIMADLSTSEKYENLNISLKNLSLYRIYLFPCVVIKC